MDRVEIEASLLERGRLQVEQGPGVPLDYLAESVDKRLGNVVAGGEPVRTAQEVAGTCRWRDRVVGVHALERDPCRTAGEQVATLDPRDWHLLVKRQGVHWARQAGPVDNNVATSAQLPGRSELERQRDLL